MNPLISLKNVKKTYASKLIFRDVTMSVVHDKPVLIMGRNGCGKSTLLKIIAGVLTHSEGEIVRLPNVKISYMPDRFPKLPFKVEDYITHMGSIQKVSESDINNYIAKQFTRLGIPESIKKQKIYNCSKGTIQKVNIMQAFLTKADLLVMDEPFSGLDEYAIEALLELIKETARAGTAVVLSCHEKTLAQRVTDNIFIFSGQSLVKRNDISNHMIITYVDEAGMSNEVLIPQAKLKETLLQLLENGHDILSVNPFAVGEADA